MKTVETAEAVEDVEHVGTDDSGTESIQGTIALMTLERFRPENSRSKTYQAL